MDVSTLYTVTDNLAKTDSNMFPNDQKLRFFNMAKDLLYEILTRNQEDRNEEEDERDTIADQSDYEAEDRIHHINWLKIDYGQGLVPAEYVKESTLIAQFGNELEDALADWDPKHPIYFWKGDHYFVYPTPTSDEAGTNRMITSIETYPPDLVGSSDEPELPIGYHYLLAVYAAWRFHDINSEDSQAAKRRAELPIEMVAPQVQDIDPRARQDTFDVMVPDDDGSNY